VNREIRRILVSTDFSNAATAAVLRGARLAHACSGELELVHVLPTREAPHFGLAEWTAKAGELVARARRQLHAMVAETQAKFGIRVDAHLAFGNAPAEIAARAHEVGADLIVLGAHGERIVRDMFVRPTAQRLQRVVGVPLLIARNRSARRYTRALVAVDFSPASAQAARAAARLFPDAALHFLHVCNTLFEARLSTAGVTREGILLYRNQVLLQASRELDDFVRANDLQHRRSSTLVKHGYPPACIRETAADIAASVVVLGARGKSSMQAGLLGSVTEQFVSGEGHDVLLARPARPRVATAVNAKASERIELSGA